MAISKNRKAVIAKVDKNKEYSLEDASKLVKEIKFDTKKQICLVEYISIEIHPSQIVKIVRKAGYEVKSIRWLKKKEPKRYNQP